jgi:hypothetical protein
MMLFLDRLCSRFAGYRRLRGGDWSVTRVSRRGRLPASIFCRLRGHTDLLVFKPHEIYLECHSCGWESDGWKVGIE